VIVNAAAVAMMRLGEERFLGKNTAFDVTELCSAWSSAAQSTADRRLSRTFPALCWWDCTGCSRSSFPLGPVKVIESHVSQHDLRTALHSNAYLNEIEMVATARLKRSGGINVLKQSRQSVLSK
jgi:hypothetical protein